LTERRQVEEHYASEGIIARVLAALRKVNGPDVPITPETLAPIDHFHGKGAVATEELAAMLQPKARDHLLDIGCGIGGPARWIAAKYGCRVTGVDLTPEFCEAARELNTSPGFPTVCKSCTPRPSHHQCRTTASTAPTRRQRS
jgi:sarcosine/dimethylglycine N-methyltransferase